MSTAGIEFRRGAVRPIRCLTDGWRLIRDDYWKFLGISLVGIIVGSLAPMYLLVGPLMCGIFYCLLRQSDGRRVTFDMLFRGFDYFLDGMVATLVIVVPVVAILVPLSFGFMFLIHFSLLPQPGAGGRAAPPPPEAVWTFFAVLTGFFLFIMAVSVAIYSLFLFVYPLIVDRGLTGMEAVGVSARAALANIGGILGLIVLNNVLSCVGLLGCYVGALLVLPISFASVVVAYRQVFPDDGFDDDDLPPDAYTPDHPEA